MNSTNNKSPKELVHEYMTYSSPKGIRQMLNEIPNMASLSTAVSAARVMTNAASAYSSPAIRNLIDQQVKISKQLAVASPFAYSASLASAPFVSNLSHLASSASAMRVPHGFAVRLAAKQAKQARQMAEQLWKAQVPLKESASIANTLRSTIDPLIKGADIETISNATKLINTISARPSTSLPKILEALNNGQTITDSFPSQETHDSTIQTGHRQSNGKGQRNDSYPLNSEPQRQRENNQSARTISKVEKPDWEKITKYVFYFCQLVTDLYFYVFVASGQSQALEFIRSLISACLVTLAIKDLHDHN